MNWLTPEQVKAIKQMPDSTQAPDSIQPVEGWKALSVNERNLFSSPGFMMEWEDGKEVVAECLATPLVRWKWEISHQEAATTNEEYLALLENQVSGYAQPVAGGGAGTIIALSTTATSITTARAKDFPFGHPEHIPAKPKTELIHGNWVLKKTIDKHPAPQELSCKCGIHIARKMELTLPYIKHPKPWVKTSCLAYVAGWGKVIPHQDGWRVEKAALKKVYVITRNDSTMKEIEKMYTQTPLYKASSIESIQRYLVAPSIYKLYDEEEDRFTHSFIEELTKPLHVEVEKQKRIFGQLLGATKRALKEVIYDDNS